MKYQYIAVEGNIGVGKTTFVKMIAKSFNCKIILEQFENNPFLEKFYENPDRYALSLEKFFMAERFRQLSDSNKIELFSPFIVSDYFFMKSKLFAQNNLSKEELFLFNRFSDMALNNLPQPQLLVYLHSSVSRLKENINHRNRSYEQDLSQDYLLSMQKLYFDFFKIKKDYPVLILDVENIDFVKDISAFNKMVELINNDYSNQVHRFKILP